MFKFDNNYKNLEQVKQFYPAFKKLHDEITNGGNFAYNSLFKGKITGIEGNDEDTAIYLLQSLHTENKKIEKIANLLKDGFTEITTGEGVKKFNKVIMVGTDYSKDSTKEFDGARILFENGYANFIIPKRYSKKGVMLYTGRLVFAK